MSRNEFSRFALNPQVSIERSTISMPSNLKTSFNVGQLVPIYCQEVVPGDEFQIKTSKVLRLQTLITPVMENLYFDVYYFFVPNRLVWSHWQELMGENSDSAWIPQTQYSVPQLKAPSGGWNVGTIADYFGVPTGIDDLSVSALPFRAYALICDEWFRDQNVSQPLNIPVTDADVSGVNSGSYVTDVAKGGLPFMAAKFADAFTTSLPSPQKSPSVTLPLGDNAPVYPHPTERVYDDGDTVRYWQIMGYMDNNNVYHDNTTARTLNVSSSGALKSYTIPSGSSAVNEFPIYNNLFADLSAATATTINDLRTAFQLQRLFEKDAIGGTRYTEVLRAHFGVISPDSRLQRPEYLGGNRFPFNVQQVTQTSSTDAVTPQGNLAGFSVTADVNFDFSKGFTEHGFIIGLAVARYEHSYQQGLERFWSRKLRFDFYWPTLAHLGNMAVLNKEIYATGTSTDDEVFGYQEAWYDYRYKPSKITGQMRSQANGSLDSWHFADYYNSQPYLSDGWIREDPSNVDRALSVSSAVADQIFGDIYFDVKATRPMPLYSVPGLIDHF